MNTGRCNCGNRDGERIMVNNEGCGCGRNRNGACANTFRPSCGSQRVENRCGCRPMPKPCPSCEDRCRMQYRECMRECRCREDREHDCGCHKGPRCGCNQYNED